MSEDCTLKDAAQRNGHQLKPTFREDRHPVNEWMDGWMDGWMNE